MPRYLLQTLRVNLKSTPRIHPNPPSWLEKPPPHWTFGHAAAKHGRDCVLVDKNPEAREVIIERFKKAGLVPIEQKGVV